MSLSFSCDFFPISASSVHAGAERTRAAPDWERRAASKIAVREQAPLTSGSDDPRRTLQFGEPTPFVDSNRLM